MNTLKIPLFLLLSVALCFGQTHTTIHTPITGLTIDGTGNALVASGGSGNITSAGTVFWSSGGDPTWSNPSDERRKDDGKGPTVQQVDASAKLIAAAKLPSSRYRELALSLGLNPSPITDEVDILEAISSMGLKVYDFDRVDNYLYRKALRQGANMRWVWKPLRESEVKALPVSMATVKNVGLVYPRQYAQPIPENVMEKAVEFLAKVPKAVFLVSDYEVINPDPFLAVTTEKLLAAGKIWIVERWDEPGFRDADTEHTVTARAR